MKDPAPPAEPNWPAPPSGRERPAKERLPWLALLAMGCIVVSGLSKLGSHVFDWHSSLAGSWFDVTPSLWRAEDRLHTAFLDCMFLSLVLAVAAFAIAHVRPRHDRNRSWAKVSLWCAAFWNAGWIFLAPVEVLEVGGPMWQARSDMRVIGTALEAYNSDHRLYPDALWGLTTPAAYMDELPRDAFTPKRSGLARYAIPRRLELYHYYRVPGDGGWVLWSKGPDRDYDITTANVDSLYSPHEPNPTTTIIVSFDYDSTNGLVSSGDIWRVKQ